MPGEVMKVDVVSPEQVLFSGEATMVITRTLSGDIAFMPGHAPLLGALTECHTRIHLADGTVRDFAIHGGFVEVSKGKVSLLSDRAEAGADIDVARARTAKESVEAALPQAAAGKEEDELRAALRRATARLMAAGGATGSSGSAH